MASKRRQRAKSCQGKVKYSRETEAYKRRSRTQEHIIHYSCPFCGHFHIGHRKGGIRGGKNNR